MDYTLRISPLSLFDEFWNPVHIIWGAIWATFFHYFPQLWRNRTIIRQKLVFSIGAVYVISIWIHSDLLSILSIICLMSGHHKMSKFFKKLAFRTIGTVPLLAIAHDMGHSKGDVENFPPKEQCKFCKNFSF